MKQNIGLCGSDNVTTQSKVNRSEIQNVSGLMPINDMDLHTHKKQHEKSNLEHLEENKKFVPQDCQKHDMQKILRLNPLKDLYKYYHAQQQFQQIQRSLFHNELVYQSSRHEKTNENNSQPLVMSKEEVVND